MNHSSWAQDYLMEKFPAEFEAAFQRAYAPPTHVQPPRSSSVCPWTGQFWASEYQTQSTTRETVSSWLEEYKTFENNEVEVDQQMAVAAENLLYTMDLSDPKLANSKFVAYLKDLCGNKLVEQCPFNNATTLDGRGTMFEIWKKQYLENIEPLRTEESELWETMEKGWEKYEANGYGYEHFAKHEFSKYLPSVPSSANPFKDHQNPLHLAREFEANKDLSSAILAYEVVVERDPHCTVAWAKLGLLQQQNEMDIQAIAALFKASEKDPSALIPLSASCTNESCIPDALDSLETWLAQYSATAKSAIMSPNRVTGLIREFGAAQVPPSARVDKLVALSILHSIAGSPEDAAALLHEALSINPTSVELINRLGAVLANGQMYDEALQLYSQGLNQDPYCPRLLFNQGISLMCSKRHSEAMRSFVKAIKHQLPVDIVEGVNPELVQRYVALWDTLRSNIEVSDMPDKDLLLSLCCNRDLNSLLAHVQ